MHNLKNLFEQNKSWASKIEAEDPNFFKSIEKQQAPEYLWIGCADSRVPATQIVDLMPGEIFVHRNLANIVVHTDFNCLSVIQFAVEVLKVKHIIVCGHYGCSGVQAALKNTALGLTDNWLRHIKDVYTKHEIALEKIQSESERIDRLCELNVIEQVVNVYNASILQQAWKNSQQLTLHGWIYSLSDGLLRDLNVCMDAESDLKTSYCSAISAIY